MLSAAVCHKARLSRDARFDGQFFTAVKTTGIYCRSICPATPPKEENVEYFMHAHQAAQAGYRPCLRCRPDSAPHSAAWLGNQALLNRAIRQIEAGALDHQSLTDFADYLGVSDRYLRKLFVKHIGTAPKAYALYHQCLTAKQLLHQTRLPIKDIALSCGFNSVRRFNDCFLKAISLSPSQVRNNEAPQPANDLSLKLSYRPPFDWPSMQQFLETRAIASLEQISKDSYGRSFQINGVSGSFLATHLADKNAFAVKISLTDLSQLRAVIQKIRRILDLDTDISTVESHLAAQLPQGFPLKHGLRLPGIWSVFEAGVRAILGQQVSVQAAKNLVSQLVAELGKHNDQKCFFPTPQSICDSTLGFFRMPAARKQSLKSLAEHFLTSTEAEDPDSWLAIKGIGPWTVNYAKMRGLNDPDIFLGSDLGVIRAIEQCPKKTFDAAAVAPWRSYLTFQLWNQL
ncbi:DNA-3-methyladenine glycosylase 2 family protein [Marinicella marina]|uniref:DNA-3-methyladenine glycosylase 2 family protein n=1 Tax=Marinicella marina TaxID=2996016 RepID=UPI0022609E53|nr:AlkA N-terminal domain-containing protein [Marinicella marina]